MNKHTLLLALSLTACAVDAGTDDPPTVDDFAGGKADDAGAPRMVYCHTTDASLVKLVFTPNGTAFDVEATAGATFAAANQRPSLNVTVDDGKEFVDFRPSGLDVVPAIGSPRFELTLAAGDKTLTYGDVQLACRVSSEKLLAYLGIAPTDDLDAGYATHVGFDIDDTLLFSSPTITRGFATGGTPAPTDTVFWTAANRCDPGCPAETITLANGSTKLLPANEPSAVKVRVRELVESYLARGADVYAITARPDVEGDVLRGYIASELGIAADHVYFEPNGKVARMQALGIEVFYGDSDSDITDATKANSRGIRVQRSPKSSYRDTGRLAKYHPGYYGETIVAGSYD